jgi:AmmeMemoRadiSam system protein B
MTIPGEVRAPAVAGSFYPGDAATLARTVDTFLHDALATAASEVATPVRLLVAPHAGYVYSGAVAARGFALLDRRAIDTVVIVGPSHVDAFSFSSVYAGTGYQTPLGILQIERDVAQQLAKHDASIRLSPRGHETTARARGEHGIEVLLPFVQRVCDSPRIVPIVMGSQDWDTCYALGSAIADAVDAERTLLVASSDLSHFYGYDEAVRLDTVFCDTLATMDAARLHESVRSGRCEACGAGPVVAALVASTIWSQRRCRVLARINSGDVTGDRDSVVGYASAVVTATHLEEGTRGD